MLASFPWFQGLAKTWIVSNVNSKLKSLGEQIDEVQKTTSDMHGQLSDHQKQIDSHQKELEGVQKKIRTTQSEVTDSQSDITNQFQKLTLLQGSLATAQTNLFAQQKKIEDVEYWIQNLYGKMTNETFNVAENATKRMSLIENTNDSFVFLALLNHVPIAGSIKASAWDGQGLVNIPQELDGKNTLDENVYAIRLWKYNSKTISVKIEYVIDSRKTNRHDELPTADYFVFSTNSGTYSFRKNLWFEHRAASIKK